MYKSKDIDIIISDVNMPVMNGLEMSEEIRSINKEQTIIFLTSLTDLSILKKAIDLGINSFIDKPLIDANILFDKISKKAKEKMDFVLKILNEIALSSEL
ncbi:MAG: response regulator, partial [Campylobacterota bacterium]|nr:response regulator [Campylobacterota bacterium]